MLEHLKRNTGKELKEVISQSNLSTRRQRKALLENANVPRKVKRTLLFSNVLILELKNKYKNNKIDKQRHPVRKYAWKNTDEIQTSAKIKIQFFNKKTFSEYTTTVKLHI